MRRKKTSFLAAVIPLAIVSCISLAIVGGIIAWTATREGTSLGDVVSQLLEGQQSAQPALVTRTPRPTPTPYPTLTPLPRLAIPPTEPGVEITSSILPAPADTPVSNQLLPEASTSTPPAVAAGQAPVAAGQATLEPVIQSAIRPGSHLPERPATRLVVPAMNLDVGVILSPIVNQTWKVDDLGKDFVGHLEGTASPGAASNLVLAGHVTLAHNVYGPFAGLGNLEPGDPIIVYDRDQPYTYIVDYRQLVDRTEVDVTYPTNTARVTLITCTNWSDQLGAYQQRLIVVGHLAGQGS
jgi:LPXTG-site transpeptidase (sortase) family protein